MNERLVIRGYWLGLPSLKKISSDETYLEWFFQPVAVTKNTEKLVDTRTGDDGEDVEHTISKAFQHVHV